MLRSSFSLEKSVIPVTRPIDTGLPQVTFDTALGRKFGSVDFDYEIYHDMLIAEGATEYEYRAAKISIVDQVGDKTLGLHMTAGTYGGFDKGIFVSAGVSNPNNTLAHESRHYLDDQLGIRRPDVNTSKVVGPTTYAAYGGIALAGMIPGPVGETMYGLLTPATTLLVGAVLAKYFLYIDSQDERRANSAGQRHASSQILTLQKR